MRINHATNLFLFFLLVTLSFTYLHAQTLEELITEGDKYYSEFNNEKALDVFTKADQLYPNNWEVYWRFSRTYVDIGEHMPTSTDEQEEAQLATYQKSLNYADKAVKIAPNTSVTYLRRAIANGRIALFKGIFSVAGVVNAVKDDCEKAIKLGNGGDFIQAVSHYVYARTHAKVSEKWAPARAILGLGWGDINIALKEYKKAIELKSDYMMIYVDYARALIEEDDYTTARKMLNKALECPILDEDDNKRIQEAKNLMKEIEDE